ncbi:enoyl-CoA hydratase/isomerase family protein [Beijerinckia indica]|uniref:Enoyl-CoA hydratase/isomerase n=1 Tax=Beijerinckia indica subsp. indica (strain ATCC 9039 / DSM 1715 / NCIMB 8712) TaxID=395963 RepID=B2ID70_BEII9|nr:enoyl-CoA hydratase/isomerase family protein [Beijerinckia indica]ACB96835.1 Enoyl-CoA hydratase/isomerase [Beijerinckia indica subsp. indica ATCC 9039]
MSSSDLSGTAPILIKEGPRVTLRLNRPAFHNRLERDDVLLIPKLIDKIEADTSNRVLILTGTGRTFSSGYDMQAMGKAEKPGHESDNEARGELVFGNLCDRVEKIRIPTICALNGSVYGGATDLALACDFRIGIDGMKLIMPAAKLGIHFYYSGQRRYVSRLGLAAAKRLFLTAQPIETKDLLHIGYLDEIATPETFATRVEALATLLAENAPQAVQGMKQSLNRIARGEDCQDETDTAFAASFKAHEFAEGMRAWGEKRKPAFKDPLP